MTDNEIIKAFTKLYEKLLDVKYDLKITAKEFKALNSVNALVKRLKAENKELTILCDMQDKNMLEQKEEIDTLCKRLKGMKKALFKQQSYTAELQAELERKKEFLISLYKDIDKAILLYDAEINRAKIEAVKEFWEKLRKCARCYTLFSNKGEEQEFVEYGDSLVKELTEGSK